MALRTDSSQDERKAETFPNMALAQMRFSLKADVQSIAEKESTKAALLEVVRAKQMLPFYIILCEEFGWPQDEALKKEMAAANEAEVVKLDEMKKTADEQEGDVEVRDALQAKADFYNRIGDKEKALEAYKVVFEKTVGVGGKMDNILTVIRVAFFFDDMQMVKKEIDRAKEELKKGGDWERRNKLRVYEGLFNMCTRDFSGAASLFLDAMQTFTATELISFTDFVLYTVIACMVSKNRALIREKVIHSPEILSAVSERPPTKEFMDSYFYCRYKQFMESFVKVIDVVRGDMYMSKHSRFFVRSMRLNAYKQFLDPYKSVTLGAMADAFGVSPVFIDSELSSFISANKLSCKIDKVGGVIESNRVQDRNNTYVEIIKQGDLLLNRMQKLAGAIDV